MADINLYAAWVGMAFGCISGAIPGLFFREEAWLGGYASWPRRMIRLAHIAFFGLAFVNLGFFLTARSLAVGDRLATPSVLLITAAVSMPLLCYLSALYDRMRHLFFIPVISLFTAILLVLKEIAAS